MANGSIVVAGKEGTVFERTPVGTWRNVSVDSKARFASVTESASGTAILGVIECQGADAVCPVAPPTRSQGQGFLCSVSPGLTGLGLLALLGLARRRHSRQARRG